METDPVVGDALYGREEALELLAKRVQAFQKGYRQNIGFIGDISVGKSSLILHFIRSLKDQGLIPVYVRVHPEPFDYFAQKYMGSLLTAFIQSRGIEVPSEMNVLVSRSKRFIPRTLRKMGEIRKLLVKERWDESLTALLELTQLLHEETGKHIILFLDNFDVLEELTLKDPFSEFGKAMMLQKETLYIVTSNRRRRAQEIFAHKLSLLFGNFEVLPLNPFDFQTSRGFIERRLVNRKCGENIKKFLMELTDGHPYYLATLLSKTEMLLEAEGIDTVSERILSMTLEHEIYRRNGSLHQYFLQRLSNLGRGRFFYSALKVMSAISMGHKKVPHMARFLKRKADEVKKILTRLVDEEIVYKRGSFYTFQAPLFSFWLQFAYQPRELDFIQDQGLNAKQFLSQVKTLYQKRVEEEQKELNKRVEELFRRFSNDVVEVEAKKLKCPSFSEISFKPSNGRVFPVEAKSPKSRWICQVAHKRVSEDDVRLFVQDIQRLRKKPQRKVLILTEGIEQNATLLAKDSRIMIWHLKNLNALLDLYNRPKVIQ